MDYNDGLSIGISLGAVRVLILLLPILHSPIIKNRICGCNAAEYNAKTGEFQYLDDRFKGLNLNLGGE